MSKRRVAITGMGLVSPVGNTVGDAWEAVLAGKSGIGPITSFDASAFPTRIAGEVRDLDMGFMSAKLGRRMDRFIHFGLAASHEAFSDSGLEITPANAHRIGIAVGSGIGGIGTIEKNASILFAEESPRKISPFFIPGTIINMISGNLSIELGLRGPNIALVTACTTATHSIGIAARTIAYGDADAMIAGGAEMATTPLGVGGFCSARAMSTRNDEPEKASRPWDRARDGFVLSDGAGVLVLEEFDHARARGADIYAELIGFGMSGDAFHITAPPDDGAGAVLCMENAIRDAGISPGDIDYVNAHGTSTPVGDAAESKAIARAFGADASSVAVSSTKSMTGHMLGAAGGAEAIFSVLALRDQVVPPTINLDDPDNDAGLDLVANEAREMPVRVTLSNSFGFGGTNGTLIFSALS